jgi:hypothetical protein
MTRDDLKDLINNPKLSRIDILVILLSVDSSGARSIKELKDLAVYGGLRKVAKWNISDILSRSKGIAVRTNDGWELSRDGKAYAASLGVDSGPVITANVNLRKFLTSISAPDTKEFIEEAVKCLEARYFRAAVVLSWVGAVSVLQQYVISHKLVEFNAEALCRNKDWKLAKTADDLGKMKEATFLQILESISVIGKNTKQELEECLKLRNSSGHPTSLKYGDSRVASHIEILILNVFCKFSV